MLQRYYYCYISTLSSSLPILIDECGSSTCVLSLSDIPKLLDKGYIINVCGSFVPLNSSDKRYFRSLSRRVSNYICKYNKLPNYSRL